MSLSPKVRAQLERQGTKITFADGSVIYTMPERLRPNDSTNVQMLVHDGGTKSRKIIERCHEVVADHLNSDAYLANFPRDTRLSRLGFQKISAEQIGASPNGYGVIEIVEPRAFKRLQMRFHAYLNPSIKHRGFDSAIAEATLPYMILGLTQGRA